MLHIFQEENAILQVSQTVWQSKTSKTQKLSYIRAIKSWKMSRSVEGTIAHFIVYVGL